MPTATACKYGVRSIQENVRCFACTRLRATETVRVDGVREHCYSRPKVRVVLEHPHFEGVVSRLRWLALASTAALATLWGCASGSRERSNAGDGATVPDANSLSSERTGGPTDTPIVVSKRVLRLTEQQLYNCYRVLFGDAANAILRDEAPQAAAPLEFPPLGGDITVGEALFTKYDRLAQAAMLYVSGHSQTLTGCGAPASDKRCIQQFLLAFAQRAFRHPLSLDEQQAITGQFWTEMLDAGASLDEALGFGIYGILSSPSFIYRTEFGSEPKADGALAPYEMASALSFFLTDEPPDAELLAAAAANELDSPEGVRRHATRLLETPAAHAHFEHALGSYFSLTNAASVALNPEATPGLTLSASMQASIVHEGELFLRNTLWSGPLEQLLTVQQTWTNAEVARQVYGVEAPEALDVDGFGPVTLAKDRAGLLTLSTFLLSGARSTGGSPVSRGLAVNRSLVCAVNPPFPSREDPSTGQREPDPTVSAAILGLSDQSELEKAQYRAAAPECSACHRQFDAFGMVLEPYDAVGRLRTEDVQGRAIDERWTTTTLPDAVGAARVTNIAEVARELTSTGAFERCLAMSFINFALGEVTRGGANNTASAGPPTASSAVQRVIDRFADTDHSFGALLLEIASSETLGQRRGGE